MGLLARQMSAQMINFRDKESSREIKVPTARHTQSPTTLTHVRYAPARVMLSQPDAPPTSLTLLLHQDLIHENIELTSQVEKWKARAKTLQEERWGFVQKWRRAPLPQTAAQPLPTTPMSHHPRNLTTPATLSSPFRPHETGPRLASFGVHLRLHLRLPPPLNRTENLAASAAIGGDASSPPAIERGAVTSAASRSPGSPKFEGSASLGAQAKMGEGREGLMRDSSRQSEAASTVCSTAASLMDEDIRGLGSLDDSVGSESDSDSWGG